MISLVTLVVAENSLEEDGAHFQFVALNTDARQLTSSAALDAFDGIHMKMSEVRHVVRHDTYHVVCASYHHVGLNAFA